MKVTDYEITEDGLRITIRMPDDSTITALLIPRIKGTLQLYGDNISDKIARKMINGMMGEHICLLGFKENTLDTHFVIDEVKRLFISMIEKGNYSIGSKVENPEYTKEEKEMMKEELEKWKKSPDYIALDNEFTLEEIKVLKDLAQTEVEKKNHVFEKIVIEYGKKFMEMKTGRPTEIYLTKDMKWELCNTLTDRYPGDLKDKILVEGPKAAFPTMLGMKVVWDAEKFEIK